MFFFVKKSFLFVLVYFLFINSTISHSNEGISFLDMNYVIINSISGKLVLEELDKVKNKNIQKLKLRENKIKDKENEINKQKNILSETELKSKIVLLKEEINLFNNDRQDLIQKYEIQKKDALDNLVKKVSPLLEVYMKENSIGIILNQNDVLMGNSKYNITKDILNIVNKNIK
jgi:Skp family chaperone for outer membrane proteins